MKKSILVFSLLSILTTCKVFSQSEEILIVTSAQCNECKELIEEMLIDMKGVKFAKLDVSTQEVKVVYNSKKTNPENIRIAISELGYNADKVEANPESVEKLKPCCRPDGMHVH